MSVTAENILPVSVIMPTFRRSSQVLETLAIILACDPAPAEVLVHVDAGDADTASVLRVRFPTVQVLQADTPQGPGGGRNRLLAAARYEIVVSLDDDSYPVDADFFGSVLAACGMLPGAGIIAMHIVHDGETMVARGPGVVDVAEFVGCGCAYRRSAFLSTSGYLPLHPAYGMEEADLALQILDAGWRIVLVNDLRVRHATDRAHQSAAPIVAAHLRNTALLAYLRYPRCYALLGVAQFLSRMRYSLGKGHVWGVVLGVMQTPHALFRHHLLRKPVYPQTIVRMRALRARTALDDPSSIKVDATSS